MTTETIDGETVAVAEAPGSEVVVFARHHEGIFSGTVGEDKDAVRAFAEAYITEQNS